MAKRGPKPFAQTLADLSSAAHPALDDLRALSDLSGKQLDEFAAGWPNIPADRRVEIMFCLNELAEDSFDLNINAAARIALHDSDPRVRAIAIRNLWEDQGRDLINPLLSFLTDDPSLEVRAAAATALGVYVYLGEAEELPAEQARRIEDALLTVFNENEPVEVRRRALESLGFAQREDVAGAIDQAYADGDDLLRVSALFAMGRSLDPERWGDMVIEDLGHTSSEVRYEAARAAAELQLDEAVPTLGELLDDSDPEVQEMSIWALGEIGGEEARRILGERLETADDDLSDLIEDALATAELMDGIADFDMPGLGDEFDDDEQARKARLN
ncbi:MAG: HEAT repeat domain-containing protein [Chloroflexi bacterium]|nr:HEAT repeat domain-containing protein [Chloroflexota bacterium]